MCSAHQGFPLLWYISTKNASHKMRSVLDNQCNDTLPSLSLCRFILASIYTAFSTVHTVINILALLLGVVPKLPMLHGFRLFGINKYWHSSIIVSKKFANFVWYPVASPLCTYTRANPCLQQYCYYSTLAANWQHCNKWNCVHEH